MDIEKLDKIGGWIAGIIGSLGILCKWLLPWLESRKHQKTVISGLRTLHAIYTQMERAESHGATRCIIFGGHDSGGLPRPGAPYYVSALHWHVPASHFARIADYRELSVDAAYIGMLLDIERNGYIRFDVSQGSPDSLLKRIYRAEGVQDSLIFFLAITDATFFFLTFASYERRFTDDEITELSMKAQAIAYEIKQSK